MQHDQAPQSSPRASDIKTPHWFSRFLAHLFGVPPAPDEPPKQPANDSAIEPISTDEEREQFEARR